MATRKKPVEAAPPEPVKKRAKYVAKNKPKSLGRTVNEKGEPRQKTPQSAENKYVIPEYLKPVPGRPTTYNEEVGDAICKGIAQGIPLTRICQSVTMPDITTIYSWLRRDATFAQMYAQAREDQADTLAEQLSSIADDGSNDTYVDDKGNKVVDHDHIQRSRLRVDTRKWIAAKLKPKKWGERIIHAGDEQAPLVTKMVTDGSALADMIKGKTGKG